MQIRASKVLFSNLLRNLSHFPKFSIIENSVSLPSLPITHFSTIPNRPMRGNRRRDDQSDDNLLQNLNFGDERETDYAKKTHQHPPTQMPSRPLRGNQRPTIERVDREKGRDQSSDTLFNKLNFGDMGSERKAEKTHTNTDPPSVPESPPEDADEIFKKMKQTGLIPNAVAMLDGLCKDGLVQEAMKLFGLMRERGSIPEVVIYTAVVEGFCKAAKFDDAKRIFRKMQTNGIVPNAFSYAIVIQGLCRGNRLEGAVEFCMEMLDAGHSPNAATLAGLVDGFCKEKGGEAAEGFVRSLRERGFAIDDKALREHLDKKGPYSPMVWEAIFGKKNSKRAF